MAPKKEAVEEKKDEGSPEPPSIVEKCLMKDQQLFKGKCKLVEGRWIRHGKGTLVSLKTNTRHSPPDPIRRLVPWVRYEGEFLEDRVEGRGRLNLPDGSVYQGDFVGGLFHGHGEFVWANGAVYKGLWNQGVMTGEGQYTDAAGHFWQGSFSRNAVKERARARGEGTVTTTQGKEKGGGTAPRVSAQHISDPVPQVTWLDVISHQRDFERDAIKQGDAADMPVVLCDVQNLVAYMTAQREATAVGTPVVFLKNLFKTGKPGEDKRLRKEPTAEAGEDEKDMSKQEVLQSFLNFLVQKTNRVPLLVPDESITPDVSSLDYLLPQEEAREGLQPGETAETGRLTGVVRLDYAALLRRRMQNWKELFSANAKKAVETDSPFVFFLGGDRGSDPAKTFEDAPPSRSCVHSWFASPETPPAEWKVLDYTDKGGGLPLEVFDPRLFHGRDFISDFLPDRQKNPSGEEAKEGGEEEETGDKEGKDKDAAPAAAAGAGAGEAGAEGETEGEKPKTVLSSLKATDCAGELFRLLPVVATDRRLPLGLSPADLQTLVINKFGDVLPLHRCVTVVLATPPPEDGEETGEAEVDREGGGETAKVSEQGGAGGRTEQVLRDAN